MIALGFLLFVVVWLAISIAIAWQCTKLAKSALAKVAVFVFVVAAVPVVLAVQDAIGMRQYDDYCRAGDKVNIYGKIMGADDLYTKTGEWRLAHFSLASADEHSKLVRYADSFVRWDRANGTAVPGVQPIWETETKIYDARTNQLLADWRSYSTRGGWARRPLLMGGVIECHPTLFRQSGYQ